MSTYKRFGFVPNGGRIYYLRRSQPPFLIPMVYEYYEATEDIKFVRENFDHLVREYEFWVQKRSVKVEDKNGNKHIAYQYRTTSNVPRPESFRADIQAALEIGENERQKFFQNIASAAESGWVFSSRWFRDRKTMKTIETTNVLPVDLNALLCWNVNILKYFANIIGNAQKAEEFEKKGRDAWKTLNAIFYNDTGKAWFDYNLRTKSHEVLFYPTVAMPLFTGCYTMLDYDKSAKVINFMNRLHVFDYPSGIPASLSNTGQQWDFPNGWPPLQHIIIEGMRKSDNPEAQEMAFKLARKWILANYKIYNTTKKMWEKVDVNGTIPKPGAGGEYDVQDGFGWTNGAILDLLVTYRDRMTIRGTDQSISHRSTRPCRSEAYHIRHDTIIFITLSVIVSYFFSC
ncbi:trehalase [Loa loa]|uniref:Trehalase n=1 Tax=Loa loa TaxID=7209 RepID=A0A1S0TSR0_LOALO|nr:trehalase [Loa loa]EFO19502.1 trehalase [Loa loa]